MHIKLEIYENKMVLATDKGVSVEVCFAMPFSTERLLIGNFDTALECLKLGVEKLGVAGFFKRNPEWSIYPMCLVSNVLSQVEDRVLRELVVSAGAKNIRGVFGEQA